MAEPMKLVALTSIADTAAANWRVHYRGRVREILEAATPLHAAALTLLILHRLNEDQRIPFYAFLCRIAIE